MVVSIDFYGYRQLRIKIPDLFPTGSEQLELQPPAKTSLIYFYQQSLNL